MWAVRFFSLAFFLIFPLPMDIGAIEINGVGAFLAVGMSKGGAVGAMLINRVLSLGSAVMMAVVAMIVLHDQFRAVLQARQSSGSSRRPQVPKEAPKAADRV